MGGIAWAWGGKRREMKGGGGIREGRHPADDVGACAEPAGERGARASLPRTRVREGDRIARCAGVCGQPCVARHFVPRVRACSAMGARAQSRTSPARTHAHPPPPPPRERRHRGVDAGAGVLRVACLPACLFAEQELELQLRLKPPPLPPSCGLCVRACVRACMGGWVHPTCSEPSPPLWPWGSPSPRDPCLARLGSRRTMPGC